MGQLRDELHASDWLHRPSALLADDWVPPLHLFEPLQAARTSVSAHHDPGRVARTYFLTAPNYAALALELSLTICLDGWKDVVEVIFRALESHQGHLPRPITDTSREMDLGDVGLGWGYREAKTLDALAFARHNVVVFLRRYQKGLPIVEHAQMLDRELRELSTSGAYKRIVTGAFAATGKKPRAAVRVDARLDLGTEPENQHWFYYAPVGSVNRDPEKPEQRYYRAPHEPLKTRLWAYTVGSGVLAHREALDVEVLP